MAGRPWIGILFCLCLWTSSAALAGVVEDAEAELQKLKQTTTTSQAQGVPAVRTSSSTGSTTRRSSRRSTSPSRAAQGSRLPSGSEDFAQPGGAVSSGVADGEQRGKKRRNKAREKSDRLFSIFGILLFLVLIGAAAVFGSRNSGTDS